MVADKIFDLSVSSQLVYQSDIPIKGKTFVKVFIDRVGEGTWEVIDGNDYQLINDSLVFTERPTGSLLIMQVATTPSELQQTPTDISLLLTIKEEIKTLVASLGELVVVSESTDKVIVVANNIDAINTIALNISEVLTVSADINKVIVVADNISHVNNVDSIMAEVINVSVNKVAVVAVSDNMASIISVKDNLGTINTVSDNIIPLTSIYTDIIPNLTEILQADTNAQIATTKAGEALASEQKAKKWADEVEDVEVEPYKYSAKHWAEKAKEFAEGSAVNIAYNNTISGLTATNAQEAIDEIAYDFNAHISVPSAYHIYNGQVSLSNLVTTAGFSTTLYTGNGTTQSITTGVDMSTQWGNDASEKFGGLVWGKSRSGATHHMLYDTIRGATNTIQTNLTNAQSTNAQSLTAFGSNGFTIGSDVTLNTNLATQVVWNFQTTHRISGTTNHGKAFTCHYNPFTGFTIVKYEGSGIAGHEIPHHLGRKLGFVTTKRLDTTSDWNSSIRDGYFLRLNGTDAESVLSVFSFTDSLINLTSTTTANQSGGTFIAYGWANSYFDEKSTLIGNYEIGMYQGTGVAGNKVITKGKPAWVMVKRLDSTENWYIFDNLRGGVGQDAELFANLSNAEASVGRLTFTSDGFLQDGGGGGTNASGGQYLYMVVYDNDSGSGKSKYPRATDTSTLNLNAHVPFANGIDTTGSKVSIAYKNETVTLSNSLTQGKNYIALLNDGSYVATATKPSYGLINPSSGDFFNIDTQKWYNNSNVEVPPRNYLDCIVYADQNGQPEYVEQIEKVQYFDAVKTSTLNVTDGFDLNQKLVDVKNSRLLGVTYTNSTNKPMPISVLLDATTAGSTFVLTINGLTVSNVTISNNSGDSSLFGIVPNGGTYSVSQAYLTGGTITGWTELR